MEITWDNLTDEMKAELKAHLSAVEEAAGVVAFDPSKPLDRTAMEQLKIRQKISGEEQELTIYEAAQKAAKAGGADKALRESGEAKKAAEKAIATAQAFAAFRKASQSGEIPDKAVLQTVAEEIGVTVEALSAGLAGDEPAGEPGGKARNATPTIDQDAIIAAVEKKLGDRLLPKYGKDSVVEDMVAKAENQLKESIAAAMKSSPSIAAVRKAAGDQKNKVAIVDKLITMATSTVDKRARGRISEMQQSGTGDILEEIPNIVKESVEELDIPGILAQAAPQPIVMGGHGPDDLPMTILSDEKPKEGLTTDDPDYIKNEMNIIGRALAEKASVGEP